MKKIKEQPIAILTIHNASEMSEKVKESIISWLRDQANGLKKNGKNYAKKFRARAF